MSSIVVPAPAFLWTSNALLQRSIGARCDNEEVIYYTRRPHLTCSLSGRINE